MHCSSHVLIERYTRNGGFNVTKACWSHWAGKFTRFLTVVLAHVVYSVCDLSYSCHLVDDSSDLAHKVCPGKLQVFAQLNVLSALTVVPFEEVVLDFCTDNEDGRHD